MSKGMQPSSSKLTLPASTWFAEMSTGGSATSPARNSLSLSLSLSLSASAVEAGGCVEWLWVLLCYAACYAPRAKNPRICFLFCAFFTLYALWLLIYIMHVLELFGVWGPRISFLEKCRTLGGYLAAAARRSGRTSDMPTLLGAWVLVCCVLVNAKGLLGRANPL